MASRSAETFMRELQNAEASGQVDGLAALFTDECELENLAAAKPVKGRAAAHQFWKNYCTAFQQIHSEFTRVIEHDHTVVLEWEARGTLQDGHPIQYRGVSILDFDGEQVRRFQTYYDSAAFLKKHDLAAHQSAGGSGAQVVS
jgi:ketosteroid isomerase-like protein